ncbi:hypothetical protein CRYUN_Cryun28dG0058700 [Craigia yunnanensis]
MTGGYPYHSPPTPPPPPPPPKCNHTVPPLPPPPPPPKCNHNIPPPPPPPPPPKCNHTIPPPPPPPPCPCVCPPIQPPAPTPDYWPPPPPITPVPQPPLGPTDHTPLLEEHQHIQETITTGPCGEQTVTVTIDDDVRIHEVAEVGAAVPVGSHIEHLKNGSHAEGHLKNGKPTIEQHAPPQKAKPT